MENLQKAKELTPVLEREYLVRFFESCPKEIIRTFCLVKIEAGRRVVCAGEPCENVYILLQGQAKGVDEQTIGKIFTFFEFRPIDILGDFEIFAEIENYRASVYAVTDCYFLVIRKKAYLKWMHQDVNALFQRTQILMKQMSEQSVQNRRYYFLQGADRLMLYLVNTYESTPRSAGCKITKTRGEISGELGYSLKTLNRSVKKLHEEGLLEIISGKIHIKKEQYEAMRTILAEKKNS